MKRISPRRSQSQPQIGVARGDVTIVGGKSERNTNINLSMPLFVLGVAALGGLTWALNLGLLKNSGNPQVSQPSGIPTEKPAKP